MAFQRFEIENKDSAVPPWMLRTEDGKLMISPAGAPTLLQGASPEEYAASIEKAALFQGFNIGKVTPADDDSPIRLAQSSAPNPPEPPETPTGSDAAAQGETPPIQAPQVVDHYDQQPGNQPLDQQPGHQISSEHPSALDAPGSSEESSGESSEDSSGESSDAASPEPSEIKTTAEEAAGK